MKISSTLATEIRSNYTDYSEKVEFLIVERICNNLPNEYINRGDFEIPENINLADPQFHKNRPVDILLGQEIVADLILIGKMHIVSQTAEILRTHLGWIVAGRIGANIESDKGKSCLVSFDALNKNISQFLEIENKRPRISSWQTPQGVNKGGI